MNESETGGGPTDSGPAPPPAPLPAPSFFPEPAFAPPGWPPPADAGLNSQPHVLQGQHWVSFDRQHWWNGSMWVQGPPPTQGSAPWASGGAGAIATIVGLIGFGLFAVFALGICMSMQQPGFPGAPTP